MNVSSVKNLNGETFSAVQDAELTEVVQTNSASWATTTIPTDLSANHITANSGFKIGNLAYGEYGLEGYGIDFDRTLGTITILPNTAQGGGSDYGNINLTSKSGFLGSVATAECSINAFNWNKVNDASDTVVANSASWGQGGAGDPEVESYVQTNSGAIDETVSTVESNSSYWDNGGFTGEVYSISGASPIEVFTDQNTLWISAGPISAKHLSQDATMGANITQTRNASNFYFMPVISPWTTADVATGIFSPLQYTTGACLGMNDGNFKAFFKGNEWFVSNTAIGQMLRGETHQSRGVHLSGATTAGNNFDLSINAVMGKNSTGSWKYGPAEDTLLRSVSSNAGGFYSNSALLYQGSKSDQRTTAWNLTESVSSYKFIQCDWVDTNGYYISKQINIPSGLDGDMTRAAFFDAVFEHGSDLWCKAQRFSAQDTTVYAQVDEYCVHTDGSVSNVGNDVQNNRPIMVQIIGVK